VILAVVAMLAGVSWAADGKVNLLVIGDVGYAPSDTVSPNTRTVAKALAQYADKSGLKFDAVLIPGDVFKVKLKSTSDEAFKQGFEQLFDPKVLKMPFYTVLGNHDYDSGAAVELKYAKDHPDSRWKTKGQWYRVDWPEKDPAVSVLMLNSMKDNMSAGDWKMQKQWMEAELKKDRKGGWMVCCGHKPFTSDGQHGDSQTVRGEFGPLLKKYAVDFYLAGHDHVLEHARVEGWPTDFVISGGGGENVNRPMNGHKAMFAEPISGFAHMTFEKNVATVKFVDVKGEGVYEFARQR